MVTITLTPKQATQLSMVPRSEATVTLTREQVIAIRHSFPWFGTDKMTIPLPVGSKIGAFIPGGAALKAAIGGICSRGTAEGTLTS